MAGEGHPKTPGKGHPTMRTIEPALQHSPELLLQAQGIRWAIFDVDGVLTDGRIYLSERGEEFKAFSTLDGHGLKLLAACGITPVVITGRDSPAVRRRVADLGIAHAVYGAADKLAAATALMATLGLGWDTLAAMGDDWPDLPLLTRAAFACAPANAHIEVKAVAHHVTQARGGHGAARECCDLLLVAAGRYAGALRDHCLTLDGGAGGKGIEGSGGTTSGTAAAIPPAPA
jgi:3-deoxy-D-manno-octulosonate 8-phosphate phosphatase (KDO 8-P phosphatase)